MDCRAAMEAPQDMHKRLGLPWGGGPKSLRKKKKLKSLLVVLLARYLLLTRGQHLSVLRLDIDKEPSVCFHCSVTEHTALTQPK